MGFVDYFTGELRLQHYYVGNEAVLVHNYIGDNGTNTSSETTWQSGKTERIDVENP